VALSLSGYQTKIVIFFGKDDLNYLLGTLGHLWVKRKTCRGYGRLLADGRLLAEVALPVVWNFILNMLSCFCVTRLPFLKKRLSFRLYSTQGKVTKLWHMEYL